MSMAEVIRRRFRRWAQAKATEHELKEQQWLRATDDAAEGIRSVAERRPGVFKAR